MVHCVTNSFALGEGYDPVALCLEFLQNITKKPARKNSGGTAVDNAFYGGVCYDILTKKSVMKEIQYPCHKYMKYICKPEAVYNRFTHRPTLSGKARRAFFDFLMSDDSPWREFKNRHETHLPEDVLEEDKIEWIYQNGWVWTDFSAPTNLQHSFLVASRGVSEWPKLITRWYKWQSQGLNKALCYIFLDMFHPETGARDKNNKEIFKINRSNMYDWPFDVCTSPEETVKNFISGRLDKSVLKEPFKDTPNYTPVNAIFGINNDFQNSYVNTIYELYRDKFGFSKEENQEFWKERGIGFSYYNDANYWLVRESEILEIIKLEGERLDCTIKQAESA
jgi:hypothetical protein